MDTRHWHSWSKLTPRMGGLHQQGQSVEPKEKSALQQNSLWMFGGFEFRAQRNSPHRQKLPLWKMLDCSLLLDHTTAMKSGGWALPTVLWHEAISQRKHKQRRRAEPNYKNFLNETCPITCVTHWHLWVTPAQVETSETFRFLTKYLMNMWICRTNHLCQ